MASWRRMTRRARRRLLKRELEAARAALTDQRLRGDPAENDAVARLREALGRKDDQLEVLEDEVSRCRADVERRRGVEEELRRELLAKTSSTPPSGAKLLRTLAHGDAESADLEDDVDGDVEALERELEEAQETISSLEAAADEAQRTIETLETAAAQDEAALEAYDGKLEEAQDRAAALEDEIEARDAAAEARQRAAALEDEIKAMREPSPRLPRCGASGTRRAGPSTNVKYFLGRLAAPRPRRRTTSRPYVRLTRTPSPLRRRTHYASGASRLRWNSMGATLSRLRRTRRARKEP